MSTSLLNIVLEKAVRGGGLKTKGTVYNQTKHIVVYSIRTNANLVEAINQLEKTAKNKGLITNEAKYMVLGDGNLNTNSEKLILKTEEIQYGFDKVKRFNYPGMTIINKCEEQKSKFRRKLQKNIIYGGTILSFKLKKHFTQFKETVQKYKTGSYVWKQGKCKCWKSLEERC